MATLNPLFGRMKGKYGGSVFYSNSGTQCMRERVLEVGNPKTSKQAIQRAILATVTQFTRAFAPVLNNCIETESGRAKNMAKVRSINMDLMRRLAVEAINGGFYTPRGSLVIAPNDYLISRGTLRGLSPIRDAVSRAALTNGALQFDYNDLVLDSDLPASNVFPTITPGDQITVLAASLDDIDVGSYAGYCRFAFKDDVTGALLFVEEDSTYKLNPDAIDLTKADGAWRDLRFTESQVGVRNSILVGGVFGGAADEKTDLAGVIVSRESQRLRSTAYMLSVDSFPGFTRDEVYPTYMAGGTQIDIPSEVYLNNDAVVTPPSPNDLIGITLNNSDPLVLPHQFGTSVSPASIMILVPRLNYSLPSNFTVRVHYTANDVAKVASFSPNDTATVDDITWQMSGANIQINRAEQTGGTNQVTVTSVTYIDRAAGIDKTWQ